ncbi:MAG: CBS domain-containing protein [Gammaproteobacteria bacterium]|nr:CBS domain-containing protein [Gammaproteobacteria bacterium]
MSNKPVVRVRDVMRSEYSTIDGLATVSDALNLMVEKRTAVLVVRKRHENDEWGMVLVSDIARQVLAVDRAPDRVNVYEIMEKPVITVSPEMDIRYCARLFTRHDLMRALVVNGADLLGLVSPIDLVLDGFARQVLVSAE